MDDLKPCQYCKCVTIWTDKKQRTQRIKVHCPNCGAAGPRMGTEEEARAAWNTRADSPELAAVRESNKELVEALELIATAEKSEEKTVHYWFGYFQQLAKQKLSNL